MQTDPTNKNMLVPQGFQLFIKRAPAVNYFIQKAPIPGLELGVEQYSNPFIDIPVPGDHLQFEQLEIIFKVDEDLTNYLEIYNWMIALGKPDSFEQFAKIKAAPEITGQGIHSDLTLLVNNSKRNLNLEVVFEDAFPVALSSITFDATDENLAYIEAAARFAYRKHVINKL